MTRPIAVIGATALALLTISGAALAHDHLASAATSEGADNRDFANPAAANPSGRSGPASRPGTVPGLGDPNAGAEQGTPSFSLDALADRLGDSPSD